MENIARSWQECSVEHICGTHKYLCFLFFFGYFWWAGVCCAEGFKEGEGVVGVHTQCYNASYWPTD